MANRLILSGGLGNQIFQYVAAREIFQTSNFVIDYSLLNPVCLNNGLPELSELKLSEEIKWESPKRSSLTKSTTLLILKASSMRRDSSVRRRFLKRLFPAFKLFASAFIFKGKSIATPDGIGYSNVKIKKHRTNLLIGNFHSYVWFDSNSGTMETELRIKESKVSKLAEYAALANAEDPLIIQMRFGDFLEIRELNVITPDYFQLAIESIISDFKISKIWIFSNDTVKAKEYLGTSFDNISRVIIPDHFSSAETLELIKLGRFFVISNSTFGWWGARLAITSNTHVVVPQAWYSTMIEPNQLIPDAWHRISNIPQMCED